MKYWSTKENQQDFRSPETFSFYWTEWTTPPKRTYPAAGICYFGSKHIVILDARHPLVRLFLKHLHEWHCHHGVEYLRALTQHNFSILKFRATSMSIQLNCVTSRNRKEKTFTSIMADVLRERLAFRSPPFSITGIDYIGPFYVSVKRSTEKRWGFLFNYVTTRAVHFEVVP